MQSEEDKEKE